MKILNAKQIREADAFTIKNEPIASLALMERASTAFTREFVRLFPKKDRTVHIICGQGNNGGDGLAVARLLFAQAYRIRLSQIISENSTDDFNKNLERLPKEIPLEKIRFATELKVSPEEITIDALLGSGLNRPLEGRYLEIAEEINENATDTIAIDVPTGFCCDAPTESVAVKATYTISFQFPKLGFLLPENSKFTGKWLVAEIGLHPEFIEKEKTPYTLTEAKDIRKVLRPREHFAYKGDYGHATLIAGAFGKAGAAVLSAKACLRTGAGLLTVRCPEKCVDTLQFSVPEAMCDLDSEKEFLSSLPDLSKKSAIAVGPGIGTALDTQNMIGELLRISPAPLILDADALNIIAMRDWIDKIPEGSILTPHLGEFRRLVGESRDGFQRLEKLRELSAWTKSVIVLKGAFSAIATPDGRVRFNGTGNPGMATAGSGDTLTGIITGLRSQNYSAEESAVLGVYLHGLAADIATERKQSYESLIASDITEHLGLAFQKAQHLR
ncbi:bifunctional NAD(P)H-hydrate repair enzyme [Fulvitalea axinellae]|uniref:Bifunctional NAD(P)H-hydrate repair enzyme n=1 Tax=Fulvitalea axinellae TaxID=1182444 RepID=A0AAU9DD54_9BACT|nr:bifunctional NAD(P)H-hydrate repair enzyme [Fulvitalea axinellae]